MQASTNSDQSALSRAHMAMEIARRFHSTRSPARDPDTFPTAQQTARQGADMTKPHQSDNPSRSLARAAAGLPGMRTVLGMPLLNVEGEMFKKGRGNGNGMAGSHHVHRVRDVGLHRNRDDRPEGDSQGTKGWTTATPRQPRAGGRARCRRLGSTGRGGQDARRLPRCPDPRSFSA